MELHALRLPMFHMHQSEHNKQCITHTITAIGCVAQLAERRSLAGELTLSYARPAVDG